jgi:hypothetical protein
MYNHGYEKAPPKIAVVGIELHEPLVAEQLLEYLGSAHAPAGEEDQQQEDYVRYPCYEDYLRSQKPVDHLISLSSPSLKICF